MNFYTVHYIMHKSDDIHAIHLLAHNKHEAYDKAVYDVLFKEHSTLPYSAWVHSVTYQNGNYKVFNTFEGKPY